MEERVAIKSGYYFEIFDKSELPDSLIKAKMKVYLNEQVYDLYKASKLEDERIIDEMFGERMGYSIDEHLWKPKCALIGQDGNIFNLVGIASRTLKDNGLKEASKEMSERVFNSHSYCEALNIIQEYVDVTEEKNFESEEEFD